MIFVFLNGVIQHPIGTKYSSREAAEKQIEAIPLGQDNICLKIVEVR